MHISSPPKDMKTLQDIKDEFLALSEAVPDTLEEFLNKCKAGTEDRIKFLESIYMTGAKWNRFSVEFCEAAIKENYRLSLELSAINSLLRELWRHES